MNHVVQFSTGIGSAEVLRRVVEERGRKDVIALTADTLVEDEDNWRFAREVIKMLGCQWITLAAGRTPMQAGRDVRVIPNDRMAVCSRILKRELLRKFIVEHYEPEDSIMYLGFDWTEPHRFEAAKGPWEPYIIACPLIDPPYVQKAELTQAWADRGIEPPRLYAMGFNHANCGGACVRGGQAQWELLLRKRPEVYAEWEAEEQKTRDMLDKDVAIMRTRKGGVSRPLTLTAFRENLEAAPSMFDGTDWGACNCMDGADDPVIAEA